MNNPTEGPSHKTIAQKFGDWLGKPISKNMFFLYGAHGARYVLPLVTLPYLTRVLGTSTWGMVAFIKAFSLYIAILVEFGFGLSATRAISQNRDSKKACGEILSSVLGAQIGLALIGTIGSAGFLPFLSIVEGNHHVFWIGILSGVFQGINLLWYFQGLEEMQFVAGLEIFSKVFATISIFCLVHSPDDASKVFLAYLLANIIAFFSALQIARKRTPFGTCNFLDAIDTLKSSWRLFLVRVNGVFFSAGNTLLLGLATNAELVGYFAAAERIVTAVRGLLNPAVQVLYPKVNYLAQKSKAQAVKFIKKELIFLFSIGCGLSISVFTSSYWLVENYLGHHFLKAVSVLRVLSFLPPIIAINLILGSHWLLSINQDSLYMWIGIRISILNLILTAVVIFYAAQVAHIGVASAIVLSQFLAALHLIYITFSKSSQFSLSKFEQTQQL